MTQMVEDQSGENHDSEFGHFGSIQDYKADLMSLEEDRQFETDALEASKKERDNNNLWNEARAFLEKLKAAHEAHNLKKKLLTADDMQGIKITSGQDVDLICLYGAIQHQKLSFSSDPSAMKLEIELPKCDDFYQEQIYDAIMRMNIAFNNWRAVQKLMMNANLEKGKTMSYLIKHFGNIMTPDCQNIMECYLTHWRGRVHRNNYQEEADLAYQDSKQYVEDLTNRPKSFCFVLSLLTAENKKSFTFEEIEAKINFLNPQ